MKIGNSASETLAPLTLAYVEYGVKKSSVLNGTGSSRKGEKMSRMAQEVGSQKRKGQKQMWTEYGPWCADNGDNNSRLINKLNSMV
jgi:hypothetical protein